MKKIKNLFFLIESPVKGKILISVVGAFFISILEIVGVFATYPLLLLASGQDMNNFYLLKLQETLGTSDRKDLIIYTSLIVVSAFILKSLFTISFRWWQLGFINSLEKIARTHMLKYYLDNTYADHKKREIPQYQTNLVTAVTQAYGQGISGALNLLTNILTVISMAAITVIISPGVSFFAIIIFTVAGSIIPRILKRNLIRVSQMYTRSDREMYNSSIPALQAFKEMRLFGVADSFVEKYDQGSSLRAAAARKMSVVSELPKYMMEIIFILGIAAMASYMFTVKNQSEAIATMGVFIVAAGRIMPAINASISSVNAMRIGASGIDILNKEITYFQQMPRFSSNKSKNIDFFGDIHLENISFKYSADEDYVLEDINLVIPQNKTVAFVGSSGSGKSTLVDIIIGMLDPTTGTVTCNGNNINTDLKSWQKHIGVVPQNVFVLPGSLAENVAFGLNESEIDENRISQAIQSAELDDIVSTFKNGIKENLGQDGGRLSGGQKQRLGIARALYRMPRILVLDEATSALDNKTEYKITKTIENLSGNMTILMVAHRLSTIKKADIIFFMRKGKIIGSGSFDTLVDTVPEFKELVELGRL